MVINWDFKISLKDIILFVLVIGLGIWAINRLNKNSDELAETKVAFAQLKDGLARAENEIVSSRKELAAFAKSIGLDLSAVKADLKKLDASLVAVGQTIASVESQLQEHVASDAVIEHEPPAQPETCALCDIWNYTKFIQLKNVFLAGMPYAQVQFDASQENPWTVKTDKIDVKVDTAIGETEDGMLIFYHKINLFNESNPELKDKPFELAITSSTYKQTDAGLQSKFFWWAPHLDIGVDLALTLTDPLDIRPGAELGFSFMGYGKTKDDLIWRFINLGAGYNSASNPFVSLTPAQYNIGKKIGILSNVWLGLSGVYDGSWGIGVSLKAVL